jgi:hypothetical protein
MRGRVASGWGAVALLTVSLWGCAGSGQEFALLRAALDERNVASARLDRAITAYCVAMTDQPDARQNCVLDKQFEALLIRQTGTVGTGGYGLSGNDATRTRRKTPVLASIRCERARSATVCVRLRSPFLEDEDAFSLLSQLRPRLRYGFR